VSVVAAIAAGSCAVAAVTGLSAHPSGIGTTLPSESVTVGTGGAVVGSVEGDVAGGAFGSTGTATVPGGQVTGVAAVGSGAVPAGVSGGSWSAATTGPGSVEGVAVSGGVDGADPLAPASVDGAGFVAGADPPALVPGVGVPPVEGVVGSVGLCDVAGFVVLAGAVAVVAPAEGVEVVVVCCTTVWCTT
jgi:hypothetical protein